ncbi:MAG: hypothetical protein ACLS4Z_04140 [Christensenellaceae bacterium]
MSAIEKTTVKNLPPVAGKLKKLHVAGRLREKDGEGRRASPRLKLLIGVVASGDAAEVVELCNSFGAALSYSIEASGTARRPCSTIWHRESPTRVVLSLISESAERAVLEGIQKEMELYLVGKGIRFTLPLTGVSSIVAGGLLKAAPGTAQRGGRKMNEEKRVYDLIIAAMQSGYADDAMNAAREAGAAGGTLIHAATLNNRKAEQLIGITLQQETEILMILTKREGKLPIMRAIQETAGLKTDAGGVLFSLPVDNLIGVGSMSPDASAPSADARTGE